VNKMVYLNPEELAFVNARPKGYLRRLVQTDMRVAVPSRPLIPESRPEKATADRVVSGPTCKECGSMVMGGKCLVCGAKQ